MVLQILISSSHPIVCECVGRCQRWEEKESEWRSEWENMNFCDPATTETTNPNVFPSKLFFFSVDWFWKVLLVLFFSPCCHVNQCCRSTLLSTSDLLTRWTLLSKAHYKILCAAQIAALDFWLKCVKATHDCSRFFVVQLNIVDTLFKSKKLKVQCSKGQHATLLLKWL